ncbi:MAG: glycerophosphodiester phosphodiesterase [Clostridium sp.]
MNLIKKYNLIDKVILSSFNHKSMLKCKEICKDIKTGLLYSKPIDNIISYGKEYKTDALHPSFKIVNKEYIENAHKNNIKVNVYTVNNVSKAKELLNWNVDGIITNYPKKMKKLWH